MSQEVIVLVSNLQQGSCAMEVVAPGVVVLGVVVPAVVVQEPSKPKKYDLMISPNS